MKHRLVFKLLGIAMVAASAAAAEPEPAVDVAIHEPLAPRRFVSVAWNPLAFLVGRLSFDVIIVPIEHHALVVSPFYASTSTAPIYVYDDHGVATRLPEQTFKGGGAELGYRYYDGREGPRGFFLGPSLILGSFTATAENGSQTHYLQYGFAADVGYQTAIEDRVSLTLGVGVQYTRPDKSIPSQQFPSKLFADSAVFPRLLLSLGVAL
jgi:hypothetical protein